MELSHITSFLSLSSQSKENEENDEKQQQQQQPQLQTSLVQSNSFSNNTNNFFEKSKSNAIIQQSSATQTIASISQTTMIKINSNNNDNDNSEQIENDYQRQQRNSEKYHKLDRQELVRFVYFGQAILIIIVALAWVAFMILEPNMIPVNITMN
ncbi:hypothetical protein DINM_001531 [Dirofilaria immitis]|nr:hypothetical protein [Dirofilaria immitis]